MLYSQLLPTLKGRGIDRVCAPGWGYLGDILEFCLHQSGIRKNLFWVVLVCLGLSCGAVSYQLSEGIRRLGWAGYPNDLHIGIDVGCHLGDVIRKITHGP